MHARPRPVCAREGASAPRSRPHPLPSTPCRGLTRLRSPRPLFPPCRRTAPPAAIPTRRRSRSGACLEQQQGRGSTGPQPAAHSAAPDAAAQRTPRSARSFEMELRSATGAADAAAEGRGAAARRGADRRGRRRRRAPAGVAAAAAGRACTRACRRRRRHGRRKRGSDQWPSRRGRGRGGRGWAARSPPSSGRVRK